MGFEGLSVSLFLQLQHDTKFKPVGIILKKPNLSTFAGARRRVSSLDQHAVTVAVETVTFLNGVTISSQDLRPRCES